MLVTFDLFWGAAVGVLFSCSFPFGPPFRSQKYKEVPPLPNFTSFSYGGEGEGAWAKQSSAVFRGSIPRSVFSAPGVTRGDLVGDPGGHSSGRPKGRVGWIISRFEKKTYKIKKNDFTVLRIGLTALIREFSRPRSPLILFPL